MICASECRNRADRGRQPPDQPTITRRHTVQHTTCGPPRRAEPPRTRVVTAGSTVLNVAPCSATLTQAQGVSKMRPKMACYMFNMLRMWS